MSKSNIAGIIVAGVVGAVVAFVILLLLIKLLWAWTIPDLFPGAVEQGLVAATISWATAGKIAILMAVFSGMASGHHARTTD